MTHDSEDGQSSKPLDSGLRALSGIAGYYRIAIDPAQLERELALTQRAAEAEDIVRAATMIGLRARIIRKIDPSRLSKIPVPAIVRMRGGTFVVFGGKSATQQYRLVDPITRIDRYLPLDELFQEIEPFAILVARRIGGSGADPTTFGFKWFLPSIWRYRRPLADVLLASLFVQIFALVTPLFFQVIVDKVLPHKGYSTLFVLVGGIALLGIFEVVLQYLRTYMLAHTTNRIDVELGQRLFRHLLRLPLAYFETRSAGQTVARMRELENIRSFLTGQGLFFAIDFFFTFVFIGVLFAYSWRLALIVVGSIPFYLLIAGIIRPPLRERVKERFNRGAESQQFMVETVVGAHTIKASAVEPIMQVQWEEKLAAYVKTAFKATLLGAGGQSAIQYVSKVSTALLLLFGAKAVIDGDLSIGELVAFNMIASTHYR
jgi:subfamily B ATP-binding cassette protein HlyB/CyaB